MYIFKFLEDNDVSQDHTVNQLGGSICTSNGRQLIVDKDNGELYYPEEPTGSELESSVLSQPEPGSSADNTQSAGSVPASSVPSQPEPGGTADLTPEPDFIHIDDPIEDKGKTKKTPGRKHPRKRLR